MICAQASLVEGIRLLLFHKIRDGELRSTVRGKAKSAVACSQIMIASLRMRCARNRGRGVDGDDAEDIDEIKIANAHMNFRTSTRELGAASYKRFGDLLAQHMAEFRPSFLCGDFNMALFCVIPELRARGFQINLAARYCWQKEEETLERAGGSCAIFRIGLCQGIRM